MAKPPTKNSIFTDDMRCDIPSGNVNYARAYAKDPKSLDPIVYNFFPHAAGCEMLYVFISGDCEAIDTSYTHTLQPGDVHFKDGDDMGYKHLTGNSTYERLIIRFHANPRLKELLYRTFDGPKRIIHLDLQRDIVPFCQRYEEYAKRLPMADFTVMAELLIEEFVYLCLMQKMAESDTLDPAETLLKKALAYIEQNWRTIRNVQEVSDALFISPSYLYEIFNKKMNTTPKAYLTERRMQEAYASLVAGYPPNETSRLVGFTTYTAFYRSFKSLYRKTPQEVWIKRPEIK